MAILQSAITIFIFLFMLGALVVIHEFGHFAVARLAGIRVLEFGIGFPPRAKVLRSEGETLYTLNWLPIGGNEPFYLALRLYDTPFSAAASAIDKDALPHIVKEGCR